MVTWLAGKMTVVERGEEKRILVGVDMAMTDEGEGDGGRDLLNWAIAKIAREGDLVVAVHVCNSPMLHKTKLFDNFLAEFDGPCIMKRTTLVGHLSQGKSIKKALVKEAKLCNPIAVVVGVNKNTSLWGSRSSLASYCAKKLPSTTSLFAIHKGKVVFARGVGGGSTATSDGIGAGNNPKHGWPLLQRRTSSSSDSSAAKKVRKLSVVEWALRLPDRSKLNSDTPPNQSKIHTTLSTILKKNSSACRFFTHDQLKISTSHFSSGNLIGNGGSSEVYKGKLCDGQEVAVKVRKLSNQTFEDFVLETDIVTSLRCDGNVPLLGVCIEGDHIISVHTFFSKGSLEQNIHVADKKAAEILSWDARFKIGLGIAEALCYLHKVSPRPVIHRDIKSSNILLTDDLKPRLSDFGLAVWASEDSSTIPYSDVVGTFGYLAPEYFMHGMVSDKIDVYAFGVVLLELLTGRKPISCETSANQESLVMWARKTLDQGDLIHVLDPNLKESNYNETQIRRMIFTADICIQRVARLRPQMSQVVGFLRGEEHMESWMESNNRSSMAISADDESYPPSSMVSHLGLALQDVDDVSSCNSTDHNYQNLIDDYLQGRWSRSSSFD